MTAGECIQRDVLNDLRDTSDLIAPYGKVFDAEDVADALVACENAEDWYDWYEESLGDFRSSYDHETDLPCDYSRHYESKAVAKQLSDGRWVGWTYFYGGGKHGEPGEVEWLEDAYFLALTEEEKVVKVRTWKKE